MTTIDLGLLKVGPHASLIEEMARNCVKNGRIQAIWVGGSLAGGYGDQYSDVDFRIAVEPGQVDAWRTITWDDYLPTQPSGGTLMQFGESALLHHLVLADGTIVDFFVQDTTRQNFEPNIVILACRSDEFRAALEGFSRPAAPLVREIDGNVVEQFFVNYWITTHKQAKALSRHYDYSAFVGLYLERMALLRAWYMQAVGKDIEARMSLHMLGALHKGLGDSLTAEQHHILGLPSHTPGETAVAIEAIRTEMATVGRTLAQKHSFAYPHDLEAVVLRTWNENKTDLLKR